MPSAPRNTTSTSDTATPDRSPHAVDIEGDVVIRMRSIGQRITIGRVQLLETLRDIARPVTIPTILAHTPSLAQSSVYRNLAILEEAGLVTKIGMGNEHACYELSEAITGLHHHHFICASCGDVRDVTLPAQVEKRLSTALSDAAAEHAFQLEAHRLDLIGCCATCAASRRRN